MARPEVYNTELGRRLRELRGSADRDEWAQRLGVSKTTIANYERGDRMPEGEFLEILAKEVGADLNWLFGRSSAVGDGHAGIPASVAAEFAFLPRYSVSASAGGGLVALDEQEIERIAFRQDWLHELGIDARQAGLLTATGDSMDPTIPDGALMLIDRRQGEPVRSGYIYVLVLDGELLVKRLMRNIDGTIDLISDNALYPVQRVHQGEFDGLRVAGRVFWVGRRL